MAYIMIVDDDEDFALAVAKELRGAGHEVGFELEIGPALKHMEERPPDLLVLDVMFPENDSAGFELAQEIRRQKGPLREMPILMLTAVNMRFPLGFGMADADEFWMPVNDFVEKPVDLGELRSRVTALLQPTGKGI